MATKQQAGRPLDFDFGGFLGGFKLPGFDLGSMMASQRKNVEALAEANRVTCEGLQAVVKRQGEILRQTLDEAAQAARELTAPGAVPDKATRQAALAKDSFEKALGNARELGELITKTNAEAFDLLRTRFSQSLDELRQSVTPPPRH